VSTSRYHHDAAMCSWQAQQHHHSLAHHRHVPAVPPESPKPLQAAMPDPPPELSPVAPPHSNPPVESCLLPEGRVCAWVVTHVALHRQRRAAKHYRCDPDRSAERPVAVRPVPVPLAVEVAGRRVAVRTPGGLVTASLPVPMWEVAFLRPLAVGPMAQRGVQGHHRCLAPAHR
jgi:hypothetical protein